VYDITI